MSGYRDDSPHGGLIPTHELRRRNVEAAYEEKITRLRAENERLRAALEQIAGYRMKGKPDADIARAALEKRT